MDGVLLPLGGKLARDYEIIELSWGQLVAGSTSMRGRLSRLRDHFELHWASLWQSSANDVIGPWHSLPQLPYVTFIDWDNLSDLEEETETFVQGMGYQTHKLPAIIEYVGDRPFAWVDDEIHSDALSWMDQRNQDDIPTLLLRTDPRLGLTEFDVLNLIDFAEAVGSHLRAKPRPATAS